MHCILRCGLKTFSGDKERMRTGDVFGQGVYLSSELNIAHSFASRGLAWEKSLLGTYLTVVASCRIVLHPSVKRAKEAVHLANQQETGGGRQGSAPMDAFPHTYYVVPEARHVRVCSLLVFADGPPAVNSVLLTNTAAALGLRRGLREEQAGERTPPTPRDRPRSPLPASAHRHSATHSLSHPIMAMYISIPLSRLYTHIHGWKNSPTTTQNQNLHR